MDTETLKTGAIDQVDAQRTRLAEIARRIHDHPELGFKETRAAGWLAGYLEEHGFAVESGICQLTSAFRATYGTGRPIIALIAEYDALPGLGHACGHNISCCISLGAAVAARQAVDRFGGRIEVIGTPAEELYGGKVLMAERDAFKDLDAAMMVHCGTGNSATTLALALQNLSVEFFGQAAHAAARPEKGINALEAMLLSFAAINSLRQHIKRTARVHGIITDGGQAPNIVPDHSAGKFIARAETSPDLEELKLKVLNCFQGAATATGARLEYQWDDLAYAPMRNNLTLARLFTKNMHALGRPVQMTDEGGSFVSTDMGNVSQLVPAVHAMVAIAPANVLLHSPEFATAATSEAAIDGLCDGAKTLSMTVIDLLASPETLAAASDEFGGKQ